MKCKKCSKIIPNGFVDCPWCGAIQPVAPAVAPVSEQAISPLHDLLISVSMLTSAALFAAVNYFTMVRETGSLTLANSGYFVGRCVGSLILAALLLVGYCKIRNKKLRSPVQLLVIFMVSSLLSLVLLATPAHQLAVKPTPEKLHQVVEEIKDPATTNKWAAPSRALLKDLVSLNQQYISEVSKLDETGKPLYTPESFRDAETIRQMIAQLQARMAVADKYTDVGPAFAKMKDYVATVDASEKEKREFLEGFESTIPTARASHKALSDKEHAWLRASLDLYQFALSKTGLYVFQNRTLLFVFQKDSDSFGQKLHKAQKLNVEFLKAYWDARHRQQAMSAELGMSN